MNIGETRYLQLLSDIRHHGNQRPDRTGTGTRSTFGPQLTFDLKAGFPAMTTKKLFFKGVAAELLWFLKGAPEGNANIGWLKENGVNIWNEWADEDGFLGPVYGVQWRQWPGEYDAIDQIANVIQGIKTNPYSRRHVVSAWNVADLPSMALEPCHVLFQFYVEGGALSCHMYQRSADMFLGVPFNIASYALLTHMIAQVCGLGVDELIVSFGDAHVYNNHVAQVDEQLFRTPLKLPRLVLNPDIKDIDKFTLADIRLEGYESHPAIKAEVAV